MDESSIQLIGEVSEPIPAAPGHPELPDDQYVRKGVASIFLEVEPLGGKRQVKITERRTRIDWAQFIKEMLEDRYPDAEKVVLVMDIVNGISGLGNCSQSRSQPSMNMTRSSPSSPSIR